MACVDSLRAQAYFDGEVDALSTIDIERHIEQCLECRSLLQDLEQTSTAIRRDLTYDRAPPQLRARILRVLDEATAVMTPALDERSRSTWRTRPFWVGALGGIGGTAVAASLAFFLLLPSLGNTLLNDLAAAQVRSLMPSHLIDVASSDQHTVKPWFAGHTDVSPVVAEFSQQGYRLIGGRADYLDHHRAAVVVYQHGPHIINVFSWSGRRTLPDNTTRNGYRMAFWKAGDLDYCAVSDTGWDELLGLVRLMQDLSARDVQH